MRHNFKATLLALIACFYPFAQLAHSECHRQAQLGLEKIKVELASRKLPNWQTWEAVEESRNFQHVKGFLSAESPGPIPFDLYLNSSQDTLHPNKKPLIVLFPGFQGASWIDHHMGRYFAKRGIHVVISHYRDTENDRKPEKLYEVTKNNIHAGMSIIDAVTQLGEVDPDRIGLVGYSFGGIRGGFLSLIDERIKAVNFIVSSGQFAKTIVDSSLPAIAELRQEHMNAIGTSNLKEYQKYLENSLPFEPYQSLCTSDFSHYLMVTSKTDTIVPADLQESFAEQLSGAQVISYHLGHIPSVLWYALKDLKKAEDFFHSTWALKN